MHKYVHHKLKLLSVFCEYFDENKEIHQHDTQQKENFYTYVVKSEIWKRAIKYKGGRLWNNLLTDIKTNHYFYLNKNLKPIYYSLWKKQK